MKQFFEQSVNGHLQAIATVRELAPQVLKVAELCAHAIKSGNKIIFCGNGGSASDSQHLAGELVGRLKGNRRSLPANALTADTSILTCIANDYGYDEVFSRQVEGLGSAGDVLIGISTSGNSKNVVRAIEAAHEQGLVTIGFLGGSGGKLVELCQHSLCISSTQDTARIQEAHILIGHIVCGLIERHLGLVE